ncbi:hypothetical protein [Leuconostoc citreum]
MAVEDFDDFSDMVTNYFRNDYRERGKVKWQGFFLSAHVSALKRESKIHERITTRMPRMSLNQIKEVLSQANVNYMYVTVQEDFKDTHGNMLMNSTGMISSINHLGFFLDKVYFEYENVRAIKITD